MRNRQQHPRGYVLLLTLLVLALATTALAGICRAALQSVTRTTQAQHDLQRRWGVISCRAALFHKSSAVFDVVPQASSERTISFTLGGQPTTLIFGDEQAKANVNQAGAEKAARALTQAAGAALRIELRPTPSEDEPVFQSWSQIFPESSPRELIRQRGVLPSVTSNLTCWGDGAINVRRASREAMMQACEPLLGKPQVTKLLAARDKDPEFDLWETLDAMNLPEDRREAADLLFTENSTCFSLWIITNTGPRQWYDLTVGEAGELRTFSW